MKAAKTFLVVALTLAAVFVALDRAAWWIATDTVSKKLADQGFVDPTTTIGGFPLVTQVVGGEIDRVRVQAPLVRAADVEMRDLDVTLTGVTLNVWRQKPKAATRVVGSVSIPAKALEAKVKQAFGNESATLSTEDGHLILSIEVAFGYRVTAHVEVAPGRPNAAAWPTLVVQPTEIALTDKRAQQLLGKQMRLPEITVPIPDIPWGLNLSGIEVHDEGVYVTLDGTDVSLDLGEH